MPLALDDEEHFRGHNITALATATYRRLRWSDADRRIFVQLAARYQISSKEMIASGTDELVRKLGIGGRTEYYKLAILKRAHAAILYLVQNTLRKEVLFERQYTNPSSGIVTTVWEWPQYTLNWLKPDWDGNFQPPVTERGRSNVRTDPPGQRARTPGDRSRQSTHRMPAADRRHPHTRAPDAITIIDSPPDSPISEDFTELEPPDLVGPPLNSQSVWSHHRDGDEEIYSASSGEETAPSTICPPPRQPRQPGRHLPSVPSSELPPLVPRPAQAPQTPVSPRRQSHIEPVVLGENRIPHTPRRSSIMGHSIVQAMEAKLQRQDERIDGIINEFQRLLRHQSQQHERMVHEQIERLDVPKVSPSVTPVVTERIANNPSPQDKESDRTVTRSEALASESLMYATLEWQLLFEANVAGIAGDAEAEYKHRCGARAAAARREETARAALDAVWDEREPHSNSSIVVSPIWERLLKISPRQG